MGVFFVLRLYFFVDNAKTGVLAASGLTHMQKCQEKSSKKLIFAFVKRFIGKKQAKTTIQAADRVATLAVAVVLVLFALFLC
jgi:hypothetical protein